MGKETVCQVVNANAIVNLVRALAGHNEELPFLVADGASVHFAGLEMGPHSGRLLAGGTAVKWEITPQGLVVSLPGSARSGGDGPRA